ncbi:MAG: hypothetical protein QGH42_06000 [Kiritimatiellia bacterium]|jgi:hypothetical protein|nr:hypothetical protein [Kiritimatiellia bacterium]
MDLRTHARLSLHFLENSTNPAMQDLPYFLLDFARNPPEFIHTIAYDDIENLGRWLYAISAAQAVSGSRDAERTRLAMIREIKRRMTGPYGMVYTSEITDNHARNPTERHSWLWGDRAVLQGLVLSYRHATDDAERDELRGLVDRMVDGLREFVVEADGCLFFPSPAPPISFQRRADMIPPHDAAPQAWDAMYGMDVPTDPRVVPYLRESTGGMVFPLVQWFELTGNRTALDLAAGLSNAMVMYHDVEGNFTNPIGVISNIHGVLNGVAGVLAANRHVPVRRHVIWAKTIWEYFVARCSSSFGWVTECESMDYTKPRERLCAEGCATIDLVRTGVELAKAGFPESWDVVERFVRNYMTQAQIQHEVAPFETADLELNDHMRAGPDSEPGILRDSREVRRRCVGALVGWGAPNDVLDPQGRLAMCIQNCCGSHLPMGLLDVWENAVCRDGDEVRINLLIEHDGPDCVVNDLQPQEGRLDVHMKQRGALRVRIPDWVRDETLRIELDGRDIPVQFEARPSRYVCVEEVPEGAVVKIHYPLRWQTVTERLGGTLYTTSWKGDTVTQIDPPGRFIPIFGDQQQHGACRSG